MLVHGAISCAIHGKVRNSKYLEADDKGRLVCMKGFECKTNGPRQGEDARCICAIHSKPRGRDCLVLDDQGRMVCAPGQGCLDLSRRGEGTSLSSSAPVDLNGGSIERATAPGSARPTFTVPNPPARSDSGLPRPQTRPVDLPNINQMPANMRGPPALGMASLAHAQKLLCGRGLSSSPMVSMLMGAMVSGGTSAEGVGSAQVSPHMQAVLMPSMARVLQAMGGIAPAVNGAPVVPEEEPFPAPPPPPPREEQAPPPPPRYSPSRSRSRSRSRGRRSR